MKNTAHSREGPLPSTLPRIRHCLICLHFVAPIFFLFSRLLLKLGILHPDRHTESLLSKNPLLLFQPPKMNHPCHAPTYAAPADTFTVYSLSTIASVTSLYTPPSKQTKPKHFDIFFDMPAEKSERLSLMYSKNVSPRQRPIFCICCLLYPANESAFAPPMRSECVSMRSMGMPRFFG